MDGLEFFNKWRHSTTLNIGTPSELAWWLLYLDENNASPTLSLSHVIRVAEDYLSLTTEKNPMVVDRARFVIATLCSE